jgi:aminomethyltransferase
VTTPFDLTARPLDVARPRLVQPGLLPVVPGHERYWVRPGGVTALELDPDDQLTVVDRFGAQAAEVTVLGNGGEDFGAFSLRADAPATVLGALGEAASFDNEQVARVVTALALRGLRPDAAHAVRLFGGWSPAGSRETFTAQRPVTVVVGNPTWQMTFEEQNPPSDLMVEVQRANPGARREIDLPPPLADPILDVRIDQGTAIGYEVKKGDYIQVLDVAGRQCSDFLAFDARALQEGLERGLDANTTNHIVGQAYPQPGLHGKFYNQDMDPLVEVIRDTVGRHDAFTLACNAKYYEDFGYPGHVNCTDNFNAQLGRYNVVPRKGWAALNLFYNTMFDEHNMLVFDEPWSRPGDYVMMQAQRDLVCASSACPDDIDPSNGWVPTDIHLRVYSPERKFSMAISHRVTPDAERKLTRQTGFHPRTSALTRQYVDYRNFWLPRHYDGYGPIAEYWACRERAAVMDLSPLRKFEVLGPDAEALLQYCMTRNIRKLSEGQVVYTAICNTTGGMIDDATVFRLGDHNFRLIPGDDYTGEWLRETATRLGLDRVWIKDSTDQLHNIAVQGPASRDILRGIIWTPPHQAGFDDVTWFRFVIGRIGDEKGTPVIVSRTGYSGELGYEVFCHPSQATAVWDAVWEAGRPHGLAPLGLDALDMLRIESGLVFAGYDFDDQVDPFEAGIGFTVPLKTKEDDFSGREALLKRKATPQKTMVGLELQGNEAAEHGDPVYVGRFKVGVVTSATRSPILRKNIALCRMMVDHAEAGAEVEVGKLDGHQKRIPATVVTTPFYDPEKLKPRS